MSKLLGAYIILLVGAGCRNQVSHNKVSSGNNNKEHKSIIKPPTIFFDTLKIDSRSAVFYYPDSLQLRKIKTGLDTSVYNSVMHEYFYQFRYVHIVLNKYWPKISIVEARNVRYLLFIKAGKYKEIIDLDTKYDPYGLFVFDPEKNPTQLELTNAESEIGFYFTDTPKNTKP